MSVGEICNRDVVIIGKHASIYTAAQLMRDHRVSEVVVVESTKGINMPVGMITDRDIVVDLIAEERDLQTIVVGDAMHNNLLMSYDNDEVIATLKRMRHRAIRRIPVVSRDRGLIGMLSIDNVLDQLTEQLNDIDQIIIREQNTGQAVPS